MDGGSDSGWRKNKLSGHLSFVMCLFFSCYVYVCATATHNPNSSKYNRVEEQQNRDSHIQKHRLLLSANAFLEEDKTTLLKLKNSLVNDNPYKTQLYQNWEASDPSPCNWSGISCGQVEGWERVTGISFSGNGVQGTLFGGFSALAALSMLSLGENQFKGEIPLDLGKCKSLNFLNLSSNFLEGTPNFTALTKLQSLDLSGNRLNGSLSSVLPRVCDNLTTLNLSSNNFSDRIPETLDKCSRLTVLDLSVNDLVGPVWPLAGFGDLEELFLSGNNLTGDIPQGVFSDPCNLRKLDLSENKLNASIPENITNCRELVLLDLSENNLSGKIPPQIGLLQKLDSLILRNTNLARDIPMGLIQCKNLTFLDLSNNNFGGSIQAIFGEIKNLQFLILHENSYETTIPAGIFDLPGLVSLDFSHNNLSGALPMELGRMKTLRYLVLAANKFDGNIPWEMGQLSQLQILDLSFNSLTGSLPPSLGNLTNLLWLMLANNSLIGPIPPQLGNCKSLMWLNLAYNQLSGAIPENLSRIGINPNATFDYNRKFLRLVPRQSGECLTLRRWLPANYPPFKFVYDILNRKSCKGYWESLLQGKGIFPICPKGKGNNEQLIISGYLQLTGNRLTGSLPKSIGQMGFLSLILLGINNFDGQLPQEIAHIPLVGLNVSFNNFNGLLPSSLGEINCLQSLDLSHNNFSGQIPTSLASLNELTKFNISYNPLLTGVVPFGGQFNTFDENSYIGDDLLCLQRPPNMRSNTSNSPPCMNHHHLPPSDQHGAGPSKMRILMMVISVLASAGILMCGLATFLLLGKRVPVTGYNSMDRDRDRDGDGFVVVKEKRNSNSGLNTMHFFRGRQFTYTDILLATANFSDSYVIGSGGFGTVYKGKLRDGTIVAVKKLQQKGPQGEREFLAEMQTLGSHEFHENLVPLLGCCLFGTEKLLVYDFMSNGSLEDWLYEKNGGRKRLEWGSRYKIALGTARALKFLHHDCCPAVIHRDMKGSNILLDEDFNPHVTDFGLARFVDGGDTHVSTVVAGTLGYVPPEYSQSWRATTKGDVYSFGVVLLELATGRRPLSLSLSPSPFPSPDDGISGNLVEWVRMLISGGLVGQALDPLLAGKAKGKSPHKAQLIRFLHLGYICTDESPERRPNMEQVLASLESLALA